MFTSRARSLLQLGARVRSTGLQSGSLLKRQYATKSRVMDQGMQYKWFLLVAAFGTMVYINVVNRLQDQSHSNGVQKLKKEYTPQEWEEYIARIERKTLLLNNNEETYLVPQKVSAKQVSQLSALLGEPTIIDLNELIKYQLENPQAKYNIILNQTLEDSDNKGEIGLKYSFTYKLRPGLFTQLVNDAIKEAKSKDESSGRFLVLNYPPNVKEAVKFEQNICTNDYLVELNKSDLDIVQYFQTVDKSIPISQLKKLDPKVVSPTKDPKYQMEPSAPKPAEHVCLADIKPTENSSAIHHAQYKLRQLNEPIRKFGESNEDVINRLSKLQK